LIRLESMKENVLRGNCQFSYYLRFQQVSLRCYRMVCWSWFSTGSELGLGLTAGWVALVRWAGGHLQVWLFGCAWRCCLRWVWAWEAGWWTYGVGIGVKISFDLVDVIVSSLLFEESMTEGCEVKGLY
jgi:hypothetical protein